MELDSKLNFTKICRCCKRTSIGMTSIFDRSEHPTYPPVQDMLRCIASLNLHENDGLPSLVCTYCIDNIEDAYTFILHLILVDEELWQIHLAREKESYTLSQATYDSDQRISTESVEKENESEPVHTGAKYLEIHDRVCDYVNDSLKVEDFNEPMQNFYQHGSADNSYENINFAVMAVDVPVAENEESNELLFQEEQSKSDNSEQSLTEIPTTEDIQLNRQKHYAELYEDVVEINSSNLEQDLHAAENVDEPEEENEEISPRLRAKPLKTTSDLDDALHHTLVERKESFPGISLTLQELQDSEKQVTYTVNADNWLKVRRTVDMEEIEDENDMGAGIDYQEDKEDSSKSESNLESVENNDEPELGNVENSPKIRARQRQTTLNRDYALVFNCKLCSFTTARRNSLKLHLQSHLKDKPFACSKCKFTFTQKGTLFKHLQNCNGVISKIVLIKEARRKEKVSTNVIPLTLEDLDDPAIMKQYYTVTRIDGQKHDDVSRTKRLVNASRVCTCTLCAYACTEDDVKIEENGSMGPEDPGDDVATSTTEGYVDDFDDVDYMGAEVDYKEDGNSVDSSNCDYTPHGNRNKARKRSSRRPGSHPDVETTPSLTAISRTAEDIGESNSITSVDDNNNRSTHLVASEDIIETEVTEVKEGERRVDSSERKSNLEAYVSFEQISPKLLTQHQKRVSKLADELRFKCKLCGYTHQWLSRLRVHFNSHLKDRPFACSKCNGTFVQKGYMLQHLRKCKGVISKHALGKEARRKEKVSEKGISLTLDDLDDPAKMKQYYTVTGIDGHKHDDDDDDSRTKRLIDASRVFTCKLCAFTSTDVANCKRHLTISHTKYKAFTCSKCNGTFRERGYLKQHWQVCNVKMNKDARNRWEGETSKKLISLPQDLTDPLKMMKKYYTVSKKSDVLKNDPQSRTEQGKRTSNLGSASTSNSTHLDSAEDINEEDANKDNQEDKKDGLSVDFTESESNLELVENNNDEPEVEREEISPKLQANRRKIISNVADAAVFKCKLCGYTTRRLPNLKIHLQSHFKDKPFACPKCNSTFTQHSSMQTHVRKCNGGFSKHTPCKRRKVKEVILLTLLDLKDPLKLKEYYTVIGNHGQNINDGDAAKVQSTEDKRTS